MKLYTVEAGDTLGQIAKRYDLSLEKLKSINPQIKNINKLSVGQKINVPKSNIDKNLAKQEQQENLNSWSIDQKLSEIEVGRKYLVQVDGLQLRNHPGLKSNLLSNFAK